MCFSGLSFDDTSTFERSVPKIKRDTSSRIVSWFHILFLKHLVGEEDARNTVKPVDSCGQRLASVCLKFSEIFKGNFNKL